MQISIPKAYEINIIIDEDKETIVIDIDEGTHSIEINSVILVRVHQVPIKP